MKLKLDKKYSKKRYRKYWLKIFIMTFIPAMIILIGLIYFNKINDEILVIDFDHLDRLNGSKIMWQALFCTFFLLVIGSLIALIQYYNYGGFKSIEIDSEKKIIYLIRDMYKEDDSVPVPMKLGYVINSLYNYSINSGYIILYGEIIDKGYISKSSSIEKEKMERKKKKLCIPRVFENEETILEEIEIIKSK